MANGTLKVGTITTSSGSGNISIGSGVTVNVNRPAFTATKSNTSQQTLTDNAITKITFDAEVFDTDSAFDLSNDKFTVPTNQGGKYLFNVQVQDYDAEANLTDRRLFLYKNGSALYRNQTSEDADTDRTVVTTQLNVIDDASAGDYYEIYYQGNTSDSGTFLLPDSTNGMYFSGHKLGA